MMLLPAALALGLMTMPAATQADTRAEAALQVSATVVPHCRISVEEASASSASGPAVTASCAASSLRALRVTTSRGDTLRPTPGRQLEAGGEVRFLVSRTDAPGPDGRTVVVTLDF